MIASVESGAPIETVVPLLPKPEMTKIGFMSLLLEAASTQPGEAPPEAVPALLGTMETPPTGEEETGECEKGPEKRGTPDTDASVVWPVWTGRVNTPLAESVDHDPAKLLSTASVRIVQASPVDRGPGAVQGAARGRADSLTQAPRMAFSPTAPMESASASDASVTRRDMRLTVEGHDYVPPAAPGREASAANAPGSQDRGRPWVAVKSGEAPQGAPLGAALPPDQHPAVEPRVSISQTCEAFTGPPRTPTLMTVEAAAPPAFTTPATPGMSEVPQPHTVAESAEIIVRAVQGLVAVAPAAGPHRRTGGKGAREQDDSPPLAPASVMPRLAEPPEEAPPTVEGTASVAVEVPQEPETQVGSLRLELSPPELGPVTLEVHHSGKTVTAYLVVDHDTARQIVTQGEAQVREALGREGLEVGAFEVSCRGGGSQHGGNRQESQYGGPSVPSPPMVARDLARPRESSQESATTVDIYV